MSSPEVEGVEPHGHVARLDCKAETALAGWTVGPQPALAIYGVDPAKVLVRSGSAWSGDGAPALDGGLSVLNPADGSDVDIVTEAKLGGTVNHVAAHGHLGMFAVSKTGSTDLYCLDLTMGKATLAASTDEDVTDIQVNNLDQGWAVVRGTATGHDPTGIAVFDLPTCSSKTGSTLLNTALPASNLAFY
jgi:hypothetical protein